MSVSLTQPDLALCDQEPIHTPGSIQPHGLMLVVGIEKLDVLHVAGDVEQRFGLPPIADVSLGIAGFDQAESDAAIWQNCPLDVLLGASLAHDIAALTEPGAIGGFIGQFRAATGEMLDVTASLSIPFIIVELEAASTEALSTSQVINRLTTAAAGFERASSLNALCDRAAAEFRRVTGFDRVMIYRFLSDGAGKVLAEARRSDQHSFLNQHFPASDIPRQARALYLHNLYRVIPDVAYEPAPLRPAWTRAKPLDMSDSTLRSVSPIHLRYLANMGVQASASFSIVTDGVLWGLVACHNETPRRLTYDVQAAGRSLVGSLGRWIKSKDETEGYRQRLRLRSFEDDIVALLSREGRLDETLSNHLAEIGGMMSSDGIAVLRRHELVTHGVCPDGGEIRALAAWLIARPVEFVFSTDHLCNAYPPALAFRPAGSGVLAVTLSADEPWVLIWFRAEQVETVSWAGNPHGVPSQPPHVPLSPRASFALWSETVRGRARTWSSPEIGAAVRLRAALLEVQQSRRIRDLNRQLTVILQDKDMLLQQKEFLIGEVNHRVQNSLQLVSSFLALQARESTDADLNAALGEARRRLTAVALVHRRLYRGDKIDVVDAGRYIEELCTETTAFLGEDWARHLSLALSPVMISTDRAVPLGLVLTELLINANKHAYGGASGPIEVALIEDHTQFRMIVSDKGTGITSPHKGFGSRVVEGLLAQLGGDVVYLDNHPGLRVVVTVPTQALPSTL